MVLIFAGIAAVKFSGTRESGTILQASGELAVND
jgi:hypothetical protein